MTVRQENEYAINEYEFYDDNITQLTIISKKSQEVFSLFFNSEDTPKVMPHIWYNYYQGKYVVSAPEEKPTLKVIIAGGELGDRYKFIDGDNTNYRKENLKYAGHRDIKSEHDTEFELAEVVEEPVIEETVVEVKETPVIQPVLKSNVKSGQLSLADSVTSEIEVINVDGTRKVIPVAMADAEKVALALKELLPAGTKIRIIDKVVSVRRVIEV